MTAIPSWQSRFLSRAVAKLIRREDWGGEWRLKILARAVFGAPAPYRWLTAYGVKVEKSTGAAGEWINPKEPKRGVVLYIHGGGYVSCSAKTHRPLTAALARRTRRKVFSVEYRRAPEARFPAALDDVIAAYQFVLANIPVDEPVAIAGDSAGGGLALALAMHARDAGLTQPACVVLFSPWTDLEGTGASLTANDGKCAMFRPRNIEQFAKIYLGDVSPRNPKASPLFGAASNLPPVQFHVGITELLLDDSVRVHERILQTAGSSELLYNDSFHGMQVVTPILPEARESLQAAAEFMVRHFERV
ncbi:MAG: alpha/beta hydrolase [Gemmatimonadaceae bacterium]|nr:alpha/beta hydrolase [Gemmatimonadaceae bacterium]